MMLRLRRKSRTDRVAEALKDAAAYTDRIARDKRLRRDLRSALDHGTAATMLVRRDVRNPRSASRLAADARLRKSLRSLVNDLDRATGRVKRKRKSHRVRNVFLVIGGTGAAVVAATKGRKVLQGHQSGNTAEFATT